MSEVLTTDEVEALMSTGLEDDALQGVIDREEDWLANDARVGIGQLTGERTQRIYVARGDNDPLLLRRPTSIDAGGSGGTFRVEDGGVELDDVVLTGPARIERTSAQVWTGPFVDVTYTPTDAGAVKRALIELVQLTITASPYGQEATEGHSYSRPDDVYQMRESLARTLNPHRGAGTVKLGSGETHRITRP